MDDLVFAISGGGIGHPPTYIQTSHDIEEMGEVLSWWVHLWQGHSSVEISYVIEDLWYLT